MVKRLWIVFMMCVVMMVSGCADKTVMDNLQGLEVSDTGIAESTLGTAKSEEDVSGNTDNDVIQEADTKEDVETPNQETEAFATDTIDLSDSDETPTEQPSSTQQSKESPTTEISAMEEPTADTQPTTETDSSSDEEPVAEITINIPTAEYVGYDANRVASLAIAKCKVAGMISLPEDLDRMLTEGEITQEEYNEYYPYDGCGYYSVFVETNLNLASTISGRRLYSEEEIADYIAGMMVLETEPYFYIECAGVYRRNSTEFYEFRCYR